MDEKARTNGHVAIQAFALRGTLRPSHLRHWRVLQLLDGITRGITILELEISSAGLDGATADPGMVFSHRRVLPRLFDVVQYPSLVLNHRFGDVETEESDPLLAGRRIDPVRFLSGGRLRPEEYVH